MRKKNADETISSGATGNQPNRRYRPDSLWSYELGAKAAFADQLPDLQIFIRELRTDVEETFLQCYRRIGMEPFKEAAYANH